MSYTVSELLLRNLRDVFGENDRVGARPSTSSTTKSACSMTPTKGPTVAVTRSTASPA
jgi:hypothetical protein